MSEARTERFEFGRDFDVTTNWLEFSGRKPARQFGVVEHIYLVIDGYNFDPTDIDNRSEIIEIDGRTIEPEVRVIDSNGNAYPTEDTTRWGSTIGLSVLEGAAGTRIGAEAENLIIAIRGDQEFRCKVIGWKSHRMR